jgi:RNA polymerase sigma-70 factor (ECF subfamily)
MIDDEHDIPELVARAQRGDLDAVGAIYDRYVDRLYRFARVRLDDASDAEDLVQVVFLKMIDALPRYRSGGAPFGAWLFRIARNAIIDATRVRHTHEGLEAAAASQSDARGPEELAIAANEVRALESALGELTDEQREVIGYRFFAGLSPSQIAAVMGRREGAVRALQFRALGALRRHLSAGPGGPLATRSDP